MSPTSSHLPASETLVLQAHATGDQVYVCKPRSDTDQKLAWILKAPDAQLFDAQNKVIAKHYAGPTWKHNDGSEVVGKVAARLDSPDANAIPWLLLTAASHSGSRSPIESSIHPAAAHEGRPATAIRLRRRAPQR